MASNDDNWTSEALTQVLTETLKEQKRTRRWRTLGRLLMFFVVGFILFNIMLTSKNSDFIKKDVNKPHTALIEVTGEIDQGAFYGSAENVIEALQKAYEQKNVKGVILALHSPGGSPVQSDLIYNEIKRLQSQDKRGRKVYAVVSDLCASGCYYIASAAQEIHANELSTVGSIGVIASQFGFVELIKKLGVDRRVHIAGKYKDFLDPFLPESAETKAIIQEHIDSIHQVFISKVKAGRQGRLKNDPLLFSGLFWTGSQSLNLGLIDGFKTKSEIAKEVFHAENIIDYTRKQSFSDLVSENMSGVSGTRLNNLKQFLSIINY
ncbi:MAG: S49 family peptidase [Gammaproteobacteria bacterium]|nr:S49 family peptidase [Gammaproteobacteria bacterium]